MFASVEGATGEVIVLATCFLAKKAFSRQLVLGKTYKAGSLLRTLQNRTRE